VAEPYPAQTRRINDRSNGLKGDRKQPLETGVHDERLVIFHEELIELNAIVRVKRREAINVISELRDFALQDASGRVSGQKTSKRGMISHEPLASKQSPSLSGWWPLGRMRRPAH
jgi:hypothetical protein